MKYAFIIAILLFQYSVYGQFTIEWAKSYGGSDSEEAMDVLQTSDGGYLIAGNTNSPELTTQENNNSRIDAWLLKLSSDGEVEWQKGYGGSKTDAAVKCLETDDGYLFAGYTSSEDGDVSFKNDGFDIWLVRVNQLGDLIWEKTYGGNNADYISDIIQTREGGYALLGESRSDDLWINKGLDDVFLLKIDAEGELEWIKTYGGSERDIGINLLQKDNGQFVIGCITGSEDGDVNVLHGYSDYWLLVTTEEGELIWENSYGGGAGYHPFSEVILLPDQNLLLAGSHGGSDIWMIKVDTVGGLIWQISIGGTAQDLVHDCLVTDDGDILCVGQSNSTGGDIGDNDGTVDALFFKLGQDGNLIWVDTYGGSSTDISTSIKPTTDGGYVINVNTSSTDEDIADHIGRSDSRILKVEALPVSTSELDSRPSLRLYPNPAISVITISLPQYLSGSHYVIYNTFGQMVKGGKFSDVNTVLNLDDINPGIHFIVVPDGQNIRPHKFVIE